MCPGGRHVEGSDLRTLVGASDRLRTGCDSAIVCVWRIGRHTPGIGHYTVPGRSKGRLVRIRILKPGARESQVELQGIRLREAIIETVEDVFFIAPVVHYPKFGRVKKAATP